jgi:hypothetical protein
MTAATVLAAVALTGCSPAPDRPHPEGTRVVKEIGRPTAERYRKGCASWNYEVADDDVSAIWCDPGPTRGKPVLAGGAPYHYADSTLMRGWSRSHPGAATIRPRPLTVGRFTQLIGGSFDRVPDLGKAGAEDRAELLAPQRSFYSAAWYSPDSTCTGSSTWVRLWPLASAAPGEYAVSRSADGVWTMRGGSGEVVAQASERCGLPPESQRNEGGPS